MPATPNLGALSPKARRISIAGITVAGTAAVAVSLIPGQASAAPAAGAHTPARVAVQTDAPTAFSTDAHSSTVKTVRDSLGGEITLHVPATRSGESTQQPAQDVAAVDEAPATGEKPATSEEPAASEEPAEKTYPNNLDGWIREALDIMDQHDIPGSYEGIHRNIIRESSGDPNAINNWDINARNGVPSKGLLQVIQPTFDRYHVEGTPKDLYDPVANIVAACNYAADRYGSMDNVDSAY
ncbi:transglycosylase SLT domain-containing protein [Streptomyces hainanensis]|uniref:Lytic transglycosylase n=1 Tax=Streptomyces hainanensis TaxID=402648 RepID=A0A4V2Y3S3_9ACTN|nr:transglycosylase SLT domain-containing protein [Streptomyces hainanensis]TDC77645.1 lytic transglycosylase [Streptomyces hainanensis]